MVVCRRIVAAVACSWVVLIPARGAAQPLAGSFNQLQVLVKTGDKVKVDAGAESGIQGKVLELTATTLTLTVDGRRVDLREEDVRAVFQRRPDSLREGALWGFGIGAGLATLAVLADGVYGHDTGWMVLAVGVYGGIGAGIGVGIDAMMNSWQPIYASPVPRTKGLSLAPILSPRQAGLRVTWSF